MANTIEIKSENIFIASDVNVIAYNRTWDKYVVSDDYVITDKVEVKVNDEIYNISFKVYLGEGARKIELNKSWKGNYFMYKSDISRAVYNRFWNVSKVDTDKIIDIYCY